MAMRRPRTDGTEPGTENQKYAPLKKSSPQKGNPMWSNKPKLKDPKKVAPLIGGRPSTKMDLTKPTPAERRRTEPRQKELAGPPMISGRPTPDSKLPKKPTPAERKRMVTGKGTGSMTRPGPRAGAAASGNAKNGGSATKYGRR
jgi:hypothetical protein